MLVGEADGMAELVPRRAAIQKAEIHGGLVGRNASAIRADIGPCAITGIECDANFRIRRVIEVELEIGDLAPPRRLLAGRRLLGRRTAHEPHAQRRTVHPGLADRRDRTHPALWPACGGTEPHRVSR